MGRAGGVISGDWTVMGSCGLTLSGAIFFAAAFELVGTVQGPLCRPFWAGLRAENEELMAELSGRWIE